MSRLTHLAAASTVLALLTAGPALAQSPRQEIGLTIGAILPDTREGVVGRIDLTSGQALQANYGLRLASVGPGALYLETHFLASPLRDIRSAGPGVTRDVATLFVTPGVRYKLFPGAAVAPYVAVGGGYALYEQSLFTAAGAANPAPRFTHRGALAFGGGVDWHIWRFISLRGEVRDFYTGNPTLNTPLRQSGQHNVVTGGGCGIRLGR